MSNFHKQGVIMSQLPLVKNATRYAILFLQKNAMRMQKFFVLHFKPLFLGGQKFPKLLNFFDTCKKSIQNATC